MKKYSRPTTEVVEALACMALCGISQENGELVTGGNPDAEGDMNAAPWRF